MPSLLVTVFVLQLVIHLVNTFGASIINSLLWNLYNRFPTSSSKSVAEQQQLKTKFIKLRKDLNATSSQDEFARWAKLRRQHDKVLEQLENSKSSLDGTKSTFDKTISTSRWLGTRGLRIFLQFWYAKQAMFWIPQGWVPYYAEWLLSFPRAPLGSISIQVWTLACVAIIELLSEFVVAAMALLMDVGLGTAQKGKEPQTFSGETAGFGQQTKPEEKSKEL